MRKLVSFIIMAVFLMGVSTGCGGNGNDGSTTPPENTADTGLADDAVWGTGGLELYPAYEL